MVFSACFPVWNLFAAAYMGGQAQTTIVDHLWAYEWNNSADPGIFPTHFTAGGSQKTVGKYVFRDITTEMTLANTYNLMQSFGWRDLCSTRGNTVRISNHLYFALC